MVVDMTWWWVYTQDMCSLSKYRETPDKDSQQDGQQHSNQFAISVKTGAIIVVFTLLRLDKYEQRCLSVYPSAVLACS